MNEYGVIFKCSECSDDLDTVERLESHVWNRHLCGFPYKCSHCGYPALNHQALAAHFQEKHNDKEVEFRRTISDELKLRELLIASVVPVSVFDDEETIYDDQNQVPHVMENIEEENVLTDTISMEHLEVVDNDGQLIHQDHGTGQVIYMENQYGKAGLELMDDQGQGMAMDMDGHQGEVVGLEPGPDDLVDCDEEYTDAIYSGHELLDESYQYIDEQGNNIYITYPQHTDNKPMADMPMHQMRAMKGRHMELIVDQVAKKKKGRSTTFWQCPECDKVIRYPSRIEEHRRQHTGEKPFQCSRCPQKFSQRGALKCHERLHSGERPYSCTWDCGKTFVSASAQRMHEKLHSGERPFGCDLCGRLFSKKSHLIRHEEAVHHVHTIEPRRSQLRGLDVAGKAEPILKDIVTDVVEGVRNDRYEKQIKKEQLV